MEREGKAEKAEKATKTVEEVSGCGPGAEESRTDASADTGETD